MVEIIERDGKFRISCGGDSYDDSGDLVQMEQYFNFTESELVELMEQFDCTVEYYNWTDDKYVTKQKYLKSKDYDPEEILIYPIVTFESYEKANEVLDILESR